MTASHYVVLASDAERDEMLRDALVAAGAYVLQSWRHDQVMVAIT